MIVIIIIIVSSIINSYCDILMVSGKNKKNKKQTFSEIAKPTPDNHIFISGIIGCIAIAQWLSVLYFLKNIQGNLGAIIQVTYAMLISSIMIFHVMCANTFMLAKHTNIKDSKLKDRLKVYAIPTIFITALYSGLFIYLGLNNILKISWWQYITLPFFSIVIFQILLGKIITIRYYNTVSGTLAMLISILSTISIIMINFK